MCWNELIFSMFNKLKEQETHKLTIPFENLKELSNYDQTAKERFINDLKKATRIISSGFF